MIDIYDYNGVKLTYSSVLSDLPITEACEHVEELMKSDYVALSWRDSQYYVLPVGAYIIYNGTTFLLLEPYEPEQKNDDEWEYKPQFNHPKMYLGKVPFSRPTKDSEANDINLIDWPYTGSLTTLLEYFCESIENALGLESGSFMYEIVGEIESIVSTTFSSIDILSALSNIANVLKCEWHIDLEQMTLYFGHIMIDHDEVEDTVLEVGRNIGIPSVRSSKEGFWNAFEPQGSTRNITRRAASGEYVQANVRLALDRDTYYHLNDEDYPDGVKTPEGIIYTDENGKVVDGLPTNQKAYIKSLIFEDIFPKLDLYAYNVRCRERYLLDDQEQKVVDHYDGTTPVYKRYAVWYMRLAYPIYNQDKTVREWVDYNINDARDLTSKVVSISTHHSTYVSFVLDIRFSSHYFNNRSVSYPGSDEYPNYIVRIQAHDITIKGYVTKDVTTGRCSFYSESSSPQTDDRDEPDAAALIAFSNAIELGDEVLFVSGVNASSFPSKSSQIIDGKELYCQFSVNKNSGAETTPLAGRGEGDDGNYGFALFFHDEDETIPPVESEWDTGIEIKSGDYEIVFQQQNDYILPTTYAQGLIPKGVRIDGQEVTDLNSLSDKSDGLKGNIVNLYNIVMDYTYEASAQNDLANETLKYIKNLFTDNNTYTFKSDNVAFKKDIDEAHASNRDPHLYIGQRVIYKNGDYELTTRVMKVVTKLDYEFEQEITVGNEVLKGAQTQLKEQVQTLISAGAGGEGGGQVSEAVIKKIVNNYVTPRFLSKINDDTAQGNIGFKEGVWFGDRRRFVNSEGDASFRDLNVEGKVITDWMQSSEYTGDGMLDTGYKLWYEEGRAKLVIDDLVARGKFTVNELETRVWTYAGGNMVFSGAGSTLFFVEYLDADENTLGYTNINAPWLLAGRPLLSAMVAWSKRRTVKRQLTDAEKAQVVKFRCYEYSDDGTMQTRNWWHANDIAMCETLNKVRDKANSDGSYSGYASNTVYKRRVAGIGSKEIAALNDGRVYDYVDLWNIYDVQGQTYIDNQGHEVTITDSVKGFLNMSPSGQTPSTDWPAAGDVIVQCGNPLDTDRQAAVTIEVQGDLHGFKVYDTINDYSMANKEWVEIGYDQTTGKAKANVYGDFRFGCRESEEANGGSYIKYDRTTKQLDIRANVRFTSPTTQQDTTLDDFASAVVGDIEDLQSQIDGEIDTWFYAGTPTLQNEPASEWTTDAEKDKHLGDLYYDIGTGGTAGFAYRFIKTADEVEEGEEQTYTYSWQYIDDTAITEALAAAARAQDTADHKRRVFVAQPAPISPKTYVEYDVGDLWTNVTYPANYTGETDESQHRYKNEILRCKTAKPIRNAQGEVTDGNFSINDWELSNGYTSKLNDFVTNTYAPFVTDIQGQVDQKAETWRQTTNPANSWTTDTEREKHVGDIWMDISANGGKKTYIYTDRGAGANPRYAWEEQNVPDEVFDEIDGKAEIFVSKPTNYCERDLWIIESGLSDNDLPTDCKRGDIVVADNMPSGTTKRTNSYVKGDWRKKDRYTDDTKADQVARDLATAKSELEQSIGSVDSAHTIAEGALQDGYIDNDEREALKAVLKSLDAEFADVTASYSVVYNNSLLNDTTEKTALYNAYTALTNAHNAIDSAFISFINAPATTKYEKGDSEGSYTYTPAGQQEPITVNLTTLQTTFNSCASTYQTALESANAKIQDKIKDIADAATTEIASYRYIKNAIEATTVTQGGLMLTSAIFLRQLKQGGDPEVDSDYVTWSGVNGTTPDGDRSIAAWYGGDMIDYETLSDAQKADGWDGNTYHLRYAKSLFRMDGTGYMASGKIRWDANGDGYVANGNVAWTTNSQGITTVTINGVTVASSPSINTQQLFIGGTDYTQSIIDLCSMFEKVNVNASDPTAEPYWMIHAKYGIYADGDLQALGYSPSQGGGGGGASVLYELNDVSPNAAHNAVLGIIIDDQNPQGDGYVLTYNYNTKHWYAAPAAETYHLPQATSQALGGIKIGYTPAQGENRNYAVALDSNGKAYVNVPWTGGSFGTEGTDNVQITLDGTTKTVLTSHQDLDYINWNGNATAMSGTSRFDWTGLRLYGVYNNGYPTTYGNVIRVKGYGSGELLLGWNGDNTTNHLYYHSQRDTDGSSWGDWVTIIDSSNIENQTVSRAGIADKVYCTSHIGSWWLSEDWDDTYFWITAKYENSTLPCAVSNADKCDGLHVHTNRNNEANKIVRTDGNGYIQCGYINSSSGDEGNNSSPSRVWGTNGSDSYLRTYLTSALSVGWASGAGYISSGGIDLIAHNNNEINFGGTNTDTTIYFGYRSRGSRNAPTSYVFGKDSAASIYCNYLYAASDVQVTSDERKKDVIGDVQLSVEQIAKMPSVLYRWNDGRDDNSIHIGTLAQKWEPVLPQAVGIGDDEMKTRRFSYSLAAYAMGVAEAKEIVALKKEKADSVEVKALKEEVSTLKEEVRELREELKRFKSA